MDNLTGNYTGEVTEYDQVHDMALQMADMISNGVMRQFPNEFAGAAALGAFGGARPR